MIVLREDSYFETLLEKDDNVPPMKIENPEKSNINPNITIISASHLGIFLFSSQIIGCAQMILMKRASIKGAIIDFAYITPAIMIMNAASFITGVPSFNPMPLILISELFYKHF